MPIVRLKPGHVQPVWAGHPWVYAQAVEHVEGGATAGDEVSVVDPRGNLLGRGFYSPGSAIPVRVLVRDATTHLDAAFFRARIERAAAARAALGLPSEDTSGYRVVHAEGDGLPGLVVDRFGDVLTLQLLTIGMKLRERDIVRSLSELFRPRAIVDRTPDAIAKAEGFASPKTQGADDELVLEFRERGFAYRIPVGLGQKTGFYFDQRGLRGRIEALSRGKRVLDAYSYVGPFAMAAARGGATEVVAVEESVTALEIGAECAEANGLHGRIRYLREDARRALREAGAGKRYDLVVVDPPRLAPTRASREKAQLGYARLAELACRATREGGLLAFCSCSAAIDLATLTRALAVGALHANVQAIVLERHFQGPDHPVPAPFPEGLYLKSMIARVTPR